MSLTIGNITVSIIRLINWGLFMFQL
jgi:hypothetical protein